MCPDGSAIVAEADTRYVLVRTAEPEPYVTWRSDDLAVLAAKMAGLKSGFPLAIYDLEDGSLVVERIDP